MKTKYFVFIAMLALSLVFSCKTVELNVTKEASNNGITYSYIDIDPIQIGTIWEEVAKNQLNYFTFEIYYRNPDTESPIQFATLIVTPAGIGSYSYIADSKINVCTFDDTADGYVSVWDTLSPEAKELWYKDYHTYFELTDS